MWRQVRTKFRFPGSAGVHLHFPTREKLFFFLFRSHDCHHKSTLRCFHLKYHPLYACAGVWMNINSKYWKWSVWHMWPTSLICSSQWKQNSILDYYLFEIVQQESQARNENREYIFQQQHYISLISKTCCVQLMSYLYYTIVFSYWKPDPVLQGCKKLCCTKCLPSV